MGVKHGLSPLKNIVQVDLRALENKTLKRLFDFNDFNAENVTLDCRKFRNEKLHVESKGF
jgi:hypothetical protein